MLLVRYWCTKCEFREPFGLDHFKWAKNFLLKKKKKRQLIAKVRANVDVIFSKLCSCFPKLLCHCFMFELLSFVWNDELQCSSS